MSQQRGMNFKEFRQRFQTEKVCETICLSNAGQIVLFAPNVEGTAVIGFADAGNMYASIAIGKAQFQREPSYAAHIFH